VRYLSDALVVVVESRGGFLMSRILVVGGAGYIGSHMMKALARAGHEPVAFDNLSTGHADAVIYGELVEGDLANREQVVDVIGQGRFDGVMHFASNIEVGESVMNPYGHSKHIIETVLQDYRDAYGLSSTSLRYFNAAGADPDGELGERHEPESHLIPLVIQAALGQRPDIKIYGTDYETPDGTCVRDYIHVTDLCDAHLLAMGRLTGGDKGRAYNLGNGEGFSVREVIEAVRDVSGQSFTVTETGPRAGDESVLVADASRAKAELSWSPRRDRLSQIVADAWNFYRHRDEQAPGGPTER
jgi:UDP-glucose 4-epimerase